MSAHPPVPKAETLPVNASEGPTTTSGAVSSTDNRELSEAEVAESRIKALAATYPFAGAQKARVPLTSIPTLGRALSQGSETNSIPLGNCRIGIPSTLTSMSFPF